MLISVEVEVVIGMRELSSVDLKLDAHITDHPILHLSFLAKSPLLLLSPGLTSHFITLLATTEYEARVLRSVPH